MSNVLRISSKKRKRDTSAPTRLSERLVKKAKPSPGSATQTKKKRRDEELSSDSASSIGSEDDARRNDDGDVGLSGEEDPEETPAEKRLRLAKIYLDNIKTTLGQYSLDLSLKLLMS
jgi:ribosomal RNA-processing protein 9